MNISIVTILILVSINLLLVEGTNGSVIKGEGREESAVVLVKPASMTDSQYTRLMKQVEGKDLTNEQRVEWWEKVQKWWSRLLGMVKDVAALASALSALVKVGSMVASAFG